LAIVFGGLAGTFRDLDAVVSVALVSLGVVLLVVFEVRDRGRSPR
jgi:hypothetical protein